MGVMIEPALEGARQPARLGPPQEVSGASRYREERWGRRGEAWRALARASVNTV